VAMLKKMAMAEPAAFRFFMRPQFAVVPVVRVGNTARGGPVERMAVEPKETGLQWERDSMGFLRFHTRVANSMFAGLADESKQMDR